MKELMESFGYWACKYVLDIALLLLAFRGVGSSSRVWYRRLGAAVVLLAYVLMIFPYFASAEKNWLRVLLLIHTPHNLLRFGICAAYLLILKQLRLSQAVYFSGAYLMIYNVYRQITGPSCLGSIIQHAVMQVPNAIVGMLAGEVFEYLVALLLIACMRRVVFCRKPDGMFLQRNLVMLSALAGTCFARATVLYIHTEFAEDLMLSVLLSCIPLLLFVLVMFNEIGISIAQELEEERRQRMSDLYRLKSIEILREREENARILRHDIKNHLLAIRQMAKSSDTMEIDHYVGELISEYGLNQICIETGNDMINGLLSVKMEEISRLNIPLSVIMDARPLNKFSNMDLNTIFGNALDNAIEGCLTVEQKERRFVDIHGDIQANMMAIIISNSYNRVIKLQDGFPVSTKKDALAHGVGLKSIKRTVEKYGGLVDISVEPERYTLTIILPLNSQ